MHGHEFLYQENGFDESSESKIQGEIKSNKEQKYKLERKDKSAIVYNSEINYFKEYWRTFLENESMLCQLDAEYKEIEKNQKRINDIQVESIELLY